MRKLLLFASVFLFIAVSCSDDKELDPQKKVLNELSESVSINNNSSDLNSRVSYSDELIYLGEINVNTTKSTKTDLDIDLSKNYVFKLRAEVAPPQIEGESLQATHVNISDDLAFVSYNTKGPLYRGGVAIFNIADETNPVLQSEALFSNVDVSAVDYYNGKLYLAGAIDPDFPGYIYKSPAVLIELTINSTGQILEVSNMIDIASYVATDVEVDDTYIYVTSGSTGGLTVLNHDFSYATGTEIHDARSITSNSNYLYILDAKAPQIKSYQKSDLAEAASFSVNGPVTPESKTEIDANEKYILAALNEGGLDIRTLNGDLKEHIARPDTPAGELDEDFVTNSVSLNEELLLIGNGGAGLYVGAMIPENDDAVSLLGKMSFSSSVNFVESKGNTIFVASGLGGLKILSIGIDDGLPQEIIPTKPCATLIDNIIAMFPNQKNNTLAHSDLFFNGNNLNLRLKKESPVYLTFIDEDAGWKNSLAYYTYDADNPPTDIAEIELHMLFPNVSKVGEGGGLQSGDRVQLGEEAFPENTVIGFCLIAKGWKNGATVDGVYRHYTNIEFNDGDKQQHVMFIEKNCKDIVLAFEDIRLPDGDLDFNDIIFSVTDNEEDNVVATAFDLQNIVEK